MFVASVRVHVLHGVHHGELMLCLRLSGSLQVTAVSSKTNTTGVARLGAFTEGTCQVALYDTPGVVHTRYGTYFLNPSSCYDTCMT